jgi:hypothetical protein
MLFQAAGEHGIDLASSWMVGDSDIDMEAGKAAGCRTVRVLANGTLSEIAGNRVLSVRSGPAIDSVGPNLLSRFSPFAFASTPDMTASAKLSLP